MAIGLVGNSNSGFRFRKAPAVSLPTFQKFGSPECWSHHYVPLAGFGGSPLLEAPLIT